MPTQIDLKKLTGVMPEPVCKDIQISVDYRSGRCYLDASILRVDDWRKSCRLALDLMSMGFAIEEMHMRRLTATRCMSVDEFACLYKQAEKLRG